MKVTKASKMKIARELSYKTVTEVLNVLVRVAHTLDVYDICDLADIIDDMSVDEFCDLELKPFLTDSLTELESELDPEDLAKGDEYDE